MSHRHTRKMFAALLFAAIASMATARTSFTSCGGLINATYMELHPTYVVPGEDLRITLRVANGHEVIEDGLAYYWVHADSLDEMPQVDNLCEMVQCPIPMGSSKISMQLYVPEFSGIGQIRINLMKRDMTPLVCINIDTEQSSWIRSLFKGIRGPLNLPAPAKFLALPDSYALSKD